MDGNEKPGREGECKLFADLRIAQEDYRGHLKGGGCLDVKEEALEMLEAQAAMAELK